MTELLSTMTLNINETSLTVYFEYQYIKCFGWNKNLIHVNSTKNSVTQHVYKQLYVTLQFNDYDKK